MAGRVLAFARAEMTAEEAVDAFLSSLPAATTRRAYGYCLRRVTAALGGPGVPLTAWTTEALSVAFEAEYGTVAPRTRNARVAAVRSFLAYARGHGWPVADVALVADRARISQDGTRAIPRATLERIFDLPVPVREKTLWRLLYESAGRAQSVLSLNIEDLDPENKRARAGVKGGDIRWVQWQSGTARLLPRLTGGRRAGPVFLSGRRPGPAVTPAAADLCPVTGRARLSYRRAATLFREATARLDPTGRGYTLHHLRHSRLTHLGEDNWAAPLLMALSGHASLRTLGIYTHPGSEAVAAALAAQDPNRRRR